MSADHLLAEVRLLLAKIESTEETCKQQEAQLGHDAYLVGNAYLVGKRAISVYMYQQSEPLRAMVERFDSGKLCDDCFGPAIHDNGMPCRCGDNS